MSFAPLIPLVLLLAVLPASAQDMAGAEDHPLVGRYEGSTIENYKHSDYDEIGLLKAPYTWASDSGRGDGPEWLTVEGEITRIRYAAPEGRSSLEIYRNYESSLKANGFEVLFSCVDQACFNGKMNDPYLLGGLLDGMDAGSDTYYFDKLRYLLAKTGKPEGEVYVSLAVGEANNSKQHHAMVEVVETKSMDAGKIRLPSADEMAKAIASDGRIALYGILFDFDQAEIKPESKPQLDEIGELLRDDPTLKLNVIGHTDNQGGSDYNLALSRRRAEAVVTALTGDYGIATERLLAQGMGSGEPVASNDDEAGRAKNRRVELAKQ